MGLSIYLSYNGGLRPPVAGRMLSANRPVRASYHPYIMFPVSFPRWRQAPSITVGDTIPSHAGHPCPYTTCHASCATEMGVVVGCTQCSHRSLRHSTFSLNGMTYHG